MIALTKAIAIAVQPWKLSNDWLAEIAVQYGVAEIHVTDEKGILAWSSVSAVVGYDFGSSAQSVVFLTALEDKAFALAQDPQPGGVDGGLMQYIGVARHTGLVLCRAVLSPVYWRVSCGCMNCRT